METKASIWKGNYLKAIIIAALLSCALGLSGTCLSLFVVPICEDLGVSRATLLLFSSIMSICALIMLPVWGNLIQKHGVRKILLPCAIAATAGLVLFGQARNIFMIYLAAGILGLVTAPCSTTGAAIIITQWFEEKRSTVMGYALTFISVSAVIGAAILPGVIAKNSWHTAFMWLTVFYALMTIPGGLIYKSPEECGMVPFGHKETAPSESAAADAAPAAIELPGVTAKKALKLPVFYILWVASLLIAMPSSFMTNMPAWGIDCGFDPVKAGLLVSVCTFVGIFGVVIVGMFNEKFRTRKTTIIFLALGVIGFAMGLVCNGSYMIAAVGMALVAIGYSFQVGMTPVIPAEVFGPKEYSAIYSYIAMTATIAGIFFTPGLGLIYDKFHSYNLGIIICIACWVLGAIFVLYSLKKGEELISESTKE